MVQLQAPRRRCDDVSHLRRAASAAAATVGKPQGSGGRAGGRADGSRQSGEGTGSKCVSQGVRSNTRVVEDDGAERRLTAWCVYAVCMLRTMTRTAPLCVPSAAAAAAQPAAASLPYLLPAVVHGAVQSDGHHLALSQQAVEQFAEGPVDQGVDRDLKDDGAGAQARVGDGGAAAGSGLEGAGGASRRGLSSRRCRRHRAAVGIIRHCGLAVGCGQRVRRQECSGPRRPDSRRRRLGLTPLHQRLQPHLCVPVAVARDT